MALDIVFTARPGPGSECVFVEAERNGKSVQVGEWIERPDGHAALRLPEPTATSMPERTSGWYWWKFVHNLLVHPFLALPWEPRWAQRAHDWTAKRCLGGG